MRRGQDLAGRPLRVGVIGAGLIAQVMHLYHLAELPGLFEVTAICDIVAEKCAGLRQALWPAPTGMT